MMFDLKRLFNRLRYGRSLDRIGPGGETCLTRAIKMDDAEAVSQFITLLPGDIITTGTPPGVGTGMKPPQFLNVGDVVTLGIEGLGEQRQEIVAA